MLSALQTLSILIVFKIIKTNGMAIVVMIEFPATSAINLALSKSSNDSNYGGVGWFRTLYPIDILMPDVSDVKNSLLTVMIES